MYANEYIIHYKNKNSTVHVASYHADLRYFLCLPTLLHLLGHMSQP